MSKKNQTFGQYELLDLLAHGGMGEIYLARPKSSNEGSNSKLIALKRILPQYCEDSDFISLFVKEIGLVQHLKHPNLVTIYDFGTIQDSFFLAMEFIHGKSFSAVLKHFKSKKIPLPPEVACQVVLQTANALQYVHSFRDPITGTYSGIIHRDVSPHNILVGYNGLAKLLDFGVAKFAAQEKSTIGGAVKGKPAYLSPEQARGEEIDCRTDIFSLGIVLWEALASERLFYSDNPLQAIKFVINRDIPPPSKLNPSVDPELERITMKALERDKYKRYQTAEEFAHDLEAFLKAHFGSYGTSEISEFLFRTFPVTSTPEEKAETGGLLGESTATSVSRTGATRTSASISIHLGAQEGQEKGQNSAQASDSSHHGSWVMSAALMALGAFGYHFFFADHPKLQQHAQKPAAEHRMESRANHPNPAMGAAVQREPSSTAPAANTPPQREQASAAPAVSTVNTVAKKQDPLEASPILSTMGMIESFDCATVTGWVCDPANTGKVAISLFDGEPRPENSIGTAMANLPKSEGTKSLCMGGRALGFEFRLKEPLQDGFPHLIIGAATDAQGAISYLLLTNLTMRTCYPAATRD